MTPLPAPEAKPPKEKAAPKAKPAPEPAPEPEPEAADEPADDIDGDIDDTAPAEDEVTEEMIKTVYREINAKTKDPAKFKAGLAKLRAEYKIKLVSELKPEQRKGFLVNLKTLG